MNAFGRIFKLQIFGESHGPGVGVTLDGIVAGISLSIENFYEDLQRRKPGLQGTTARKEEDAPVFLSGVFNGYTTGSPLTIFFENKNVRSADYEQQKQIPRPGHADFVASKRFRGFEDYRGGGHFSGRLTLPLVAAGVVAKLIARLQLPSVSCKARVISVAGTKDIERAIEKAISQQDSVGAIVECRVAGLQVGLGEPFFDSLESVISHGVFSIPAIKGIEFGVGFAAAQMRGSEHNDALLSSHGETLTNHSGGVAGGLSNGNEFIFRVVVKPASSTPAPQNSLNLETGQIEEFSVKGRHDLCIGLRVPPVLEAITMCAILDLKLLHDAVQM